MRNTVFKVRVKNGGIMMSIGRGIAVVGIWLAVAASCFSKDVAIVMVVCFAAFWATVNVVPSGGDNSAEEEDDDEDEDEEQGG